MTCYIFFFISLAKNNWTRSIFLYFINVYWPSLWGPYTGYKKNQKKSLRSTIRPHGMIVVNIGFWKKKKKTRSKEVLNTILNRVLFNLSKKKIIGNISIFWFVPTYIRIEFLWYYIVDVRGKRRVYWDLI